MSSNAPETPSSASDENDRDGSDEADSQTGVTTHVLLKHPTAESTDRERYEYERAQLLHRYVGSKLHSGILDAIEQLKYLDIVRYTHWGSTSTTPLPSQNNHPIDVLSLARLVMRNTMDRSVRTHQDVILRMFERCPSAAPLVEDMTWFFFTEYFSLCETEKRFNQYRLEALDTIKDTENSRTPQKKSKKRSGSVQLERTRSFLELSGKLSGNTAVTRQKAKQKSKQRAAANRIGGGRLDLGGSSDSDDDGQSKKGAKPLTGDEEKELQLRRMRDTLRLKFESKQNETFVPPHVMTPREVSQRRNGDRPTGATLNDTTASGAEEDGSARRSASVASSHMTVASMPESNATASSTSSSTAAQQHQLRFGLKMKLSGEIDPDQAALVLAEAEELDTIDFTNDDLMSSCSMPSPSKVEAHRVAEIVKHASDLIHREHDRMFGRMASNYVDLFRFMKPSQQTVLIPKLPDFLARMVVQVLYAQMPYCRDVLTRRIKKRIKKKISFWVTGIEDSKLGTWNTEFRSEIVSDPVKVHPPVTLSRPPSFSTNEKPFTGSGNSGSGGRPLKASINEPHAPTDPVVKLSRHGGAVFPRKVRIGRGPKERPGPGTATAGPGADGTYPEVPVVSENNFDAEFRKAFDEIANDFERLAKGEAVSSITGSSLQTRSGILVPRAPTGGDVTHNNTVYEQKKKKENQDPRHVENHRHAPVNKRVELWHEYGRPSHCSTGAVIPLHLTFNLRTISPFMGRFLHDKGVLEQQQGTKLFMKWS